MATATQFVPSSGYYRRPVQRYDATRTVGDALESIPTLFGRLLKIAATRNPRTQVYRSGEFDGLGTPLEVGATLERHHRDLFLEWLDKPLQFRTADMAAYFRREGPSGVRRLWALQDWRECSQLLPPSTIDAQRLHFRLDMTVLIALVAARLD